MHSLVARQLRKLGLDPAAPPDAAGWAAFLERMSHVCVEADQDRYLYERSMSISSRELQSLYEDLKSGTEARLAEQGRSLALLRATLESTTDGILVLALDGEVVVYNDRFVEIVGIPPAVLERGAPEVRAVWFEAHVEDVPTFRRVLARLAADPRAEIHEVACIGGGRVVEVSSRPQLVGGELVGRVWGVRDITARVRHEEELRAVNTRITALVSHMPGGTLVEDENRRVIHLNAAFCALFGLTDGPEALVGVDRMALAARVGRAFADPEAFVAGVDAILRDRRTVEREDLTLSDGRLLERDGFPIFVDGQYGGFFWRYADVTEARRLRASLRQTERLASVGVLAAGVAHEINNPLGYVLNNLEALSGAVAGEAATFVAEARHGAERVRDIVRDLRTFSRTPSEPSRPVDLARVVDSACRMARNELRPRARLVREEGPTPTVLGNESRLAQVFLNLLVNASHAIPEGAPDANTVTVRTWTDPAGRAVVEVRDTGAGMPPEIVRRIFDPFFTTGEAGMGLGLSICSNIVREAGGEITVDSAPGRGATFRVFLPATADAMPRPSPVPPPAAPAPAVPPPVLPRLLLVDDEALLAESFARLLRRRFRVTVAGTAEDALTCLAAERFDLVACDLMMPGMSGMDLYEAVRARDPDVAARMLFVTGGAFTPRAREFAVSLPPGRLLEKPFELDAFLRAAGALMAS